MLPRQTRLRSRRNAARPARRTARAARSRSRGPSPSRSSRRPCRSAGGRDARPAEPALAIAPHGARLPVRAGCTRAAAVDGGLAAVLDAVEARGRAAEAADAGAALAVVVRIAGDAVRAVGAAVAAVGRSLVAVLHAVGARRSPTHAALAHAARNRSRRCSPAPAGHAPHDGPPQSTPVSRSLRVPSMHVGHGVATPLRRLSLATGTRRAMGDLATERSLVQRAVPVVGGVAHVVDREDDEDATRSGRCGDVDAAGALWPRPSPCCRSAAWPSSRERRRSRRGGVLPLRGHAGVERPRRRKAGSRDRMACRRVPELEVPGEMSLPALAGPKCTPVSRWSDLRTCRPLALTVASLLRPETPASCAPLRPRRDENRRRHGNGQYESGHAPRGHGLPLRCLPPAERIDAGGGLVPNERLGTQAKPAGRFIAVLWPWRSAGPNVLATLHRDVPTRRDRARAGTRRSSPDPMRDSHEHDIGEVASSARARSHRYRSR